MRIEQLQHFLEVAKCNSLSQAAENLFIGKSTLSNSISSLENEFNKPLFMRTRRGTFLSPFGEEILPMAQAAVESVENIYGISQQDQSINSHMLHIYSHPIGAISAIVELFKYMSTHFPEATIAVPETQAENVVSDLTGSGHSVGLISAGFLKHSYVQTQAENHDFICEPVYEDTMYVYVHKNHPFASLKSIPLERLFNETVVIFRLFMLPETNTFYQDFRKLRHCYTVDSYELLKKSVLYENMIAVSPSLAFYHSTSLEAGTVVQIPLTDCSLRLITSLIYKKDKNRLSPLEKAAVDFLRDFYLAMANE